MRVRVRTCSCRRRGRRSAGWWILLGLFVLAGSGVVSVGVLLWVIWIGVPVLAVDAVVRRVWPGMEEYR